MKRYYETNMADYLAATNLEGYSIKFDRLQFPYNICLFKSDNSLQAYSLNFV